MKSQARGYGWMGDDMRPTLTLTYPQPGANTTLTRFLVGMHDYYSGLALDTFQVTADFAIDGIAAGKNLASRFRATDQGVFEYRLATPLTRLPRGTLTVSIKDRQGNVTQIARTFSVAGQ